MRRLRLLILLFVAALALPLGYLVVRTYQGLEHEESAELRFFGETLFDAMQEELADMIRLEESRSVDAYYTLQEQAPEQPYILAYVQADTDSLADASVTLVKKDRNSPYVVKKEQQDKVTKESVEKALKNQEKLKVAWLAKKIIAKEKTRKETADTAAQLTLQNNSFANRYLSLERTSKQREYLSEQKTRVEQLTAEQAQNLAPTTQSQKKGKDKSVSKNTVREQDILPETSRVKLGLAPETFAVEVNPLQSVFLDDGTIFIFRRIVIENRILRQGFVLNVKMFFEHLAQEYFLNQPLAAYSRLILTARGNGELGEQLEAGSSVRSPRFFIERDFPRPFDFLQARLQCGQSPASSALRTVDLLVVALAVVICLGVLAIYKSAGVVVELSERRTGFVSSVTHELKTPLTNIQLYIEMLEQGVARDTNREQDYFRILRTESERLSRLINNVLEFSKLEKRNRAFSMTEGDLSEIVTEVRALMDEKLKKEGFRCEIRTPKDSGELLAVRYDREAMIQVLLNLMDNCVKFGSNSGKKEITVSLYSESDGLALRVSDTGPGIPQKALAKVFEDFYRVDNSLTRSTKGTGIGLALVKKLVREMSGKVRAENNPKGGCSIIVWLPAKGTG